MDELPFRVKKGLPIGFFDEYTAIGDLHIGFEEEMNSSGYNIQSKTEELTRKVLDINSRKLILLGDIRYNFTRIAPSEGGVLMRVLSALSSKFTEIVITKGNHDGGLSTITNRIDGIKLVNEFVYGDVGFMHGHAMPTKEMVKRVRTICFGHLHPSVTMVDKNGVLYKEDCWSVFDVHFPRSKYKNQRVDSAVAFPKFNPYIGSTDKTNGIGFVKYLKLRRRLGVDLIIV